MDVNNSNQQQQQQQRRWSENQLKNICETNTYEYTPVYMYIYIHSIERKQTIEDGVIGFCKRAS